MSAGLSRYSARMAWPVVLKPSALNTSEAISPDSIFWSGACSSARRSALRSVTVKMNSLKWPDCRAASCLLSVKPRSFAEFSPPLAYIKFRALNVRTVVAEDRPSPESPTRRFVSRPASPCVCPQLRHHVCEPGRNQYGVPAVAEVCPLGSSRSGTGARSL